MFPGPPRSRVGRAMTPAQFAPAVLAWFDVHGRHDLPWANPRSAYRVWVSEVMLQQTQVATVIPYFLRFLERFPDVAALASAPVDDVLHHWSGLGYYARARNLQRAAQVIVDEHAGRVPDDLALLEALPGIGRSTAGAILSLAYGRRQPILDGNVKRVLSRWAGIDGWPGEATVLARLWATSEAVTPAHRVGDYTQAIMDLGATLCVRTRPRCGECPVATGCIARREDAVHRYPGRRPPKAARPKRTIAWLVAQGPEGVWLVRRPEAGLWGGLWGFPEFSSAEAAESYASERLTVAGKPERAPTVLHRFTHFDLTIHPLIVRLDRGPGGVEEGHAVWYNARTPASVGLAAPVAELIRRLDAGQASPGRTGQEQR